MQIMLDVTQITPIRSIKHSLAEIEHTRQAIQENYFKLRKEKIKEEKKQKEYENAVIENKDPLDIELLNIELQEIKAAREEVQNYVEGAIRKINFFANQHKLLLEKVGKQTITEEDYEREECRYHIMTCMKQALHAARTRSGIIDEGNHIYLFDLGINGAHAQAEVFAYLKLEQEVIDSGRFPTHEMTMRWLEACADLWQDCPNKYAARRGVTTLDRESLCTSS
jgi:hypothetical protein